MMTLWTDERKDKVRTGYELGHTFLQIGKDLDPPATRGAVAGILRRMGLLGARKAPHWKPKVIVSNYKPLPFGAIGVMQLTRSSCRWPISRDGGVHSFCGERSLRGKPYCGKHCSQAYDVIRTRRRGMKNQASN